MFLILVVLVTSTAAAVAVMLTVRRFAPPKGFLKDVVLAAGVFGVIGVAFAVILAFVVFLAFEGYQRAWEGASREAVAVAQLARTTRLLPDEDAQELRNDLACYARAVVSDEWPQMAVGLESDVVEEWLAKIETEVDAVAVVSPRTEVALSHWLDQAADRREGRRARLIQAEPVVPEAVWLLLLAGALLTIGYLTIFADPTERWWVQSLMIGSVTLLVVGGLLVVVFLDRPYQQDGAYVGPIDMQATIRLMDGDFADDPTYQPPCDDHGRPIAELIPNEPPVRFASVPVAQWTRAAAF